MSLTFAEVIFSRTPMVLWWRLDQRPLVFFFTVLAHSSHLTHRSLRSVRYIMLRCVSRFMRPSRTSMCHNSNLSLFKSSCCQTCKLTFHVRQRIMISYSLTSIFSIHNKILVVTGQTMMSTSLSQCVSYATCTTQCSLSFRQINQSWMLKHTSSFSNCVVLQVLRPPTSMMTYSHHPRQQKWQV